MWFAAATSVDPKDISEYKDDDHLKIFLEQLVKIFIASFKSDDLRRLTYIDYKETNMTQLQDEQ